MKTTSQKQSGFTIIETLIVLTVSSALLVSAIALVAGKQRYVEFHQAMGDIQTKVIQTMSEVSSGYYPNAGNIICNRLGNALVINTTGNGTPQGSNDDCIFMGKAIQFGNSGDGTTYIVHAIAGLDDNKGSLNTAMPQTLDADGSREIKQLRNGLKVTDMRYVNGAQTRDITAVAFINSLGSYDSKNQLQSGSVQVSMVPVTPSGTVPGTGIADEVVNINSQLKDADTLLNPPNKDMRIEICFDGGGGKQYAQLTIGSNGRALSTTIDYKSSPCW